MKRNQNGNVLNCSALSRLLHMVPLLVLFVTLFSSCAEESINTTSTGTNITKWYNVMLLNVNDDVEDELGKSTVTINQKAYCENTSLNLKDEFIPIAYLNVELSKTLIEVDSKDALPVKLVKSYTSSKTPFKSDTQLGSDVVEVFEFDDSQVATISYGIRYDIKVSAQDTLHTPHIEFDKIVYSKHTVNQDGEQTETEDPYKVTLEFDIAYSDTNTTTEPQTYSITASPWYKKVITTEPTVVKSVEYDGMYTGTPVDAYEVTEYVTTNKGSFENFYKVSLQHMFNGPKKREQPTEDTQFNNVSTGKLSQDKFSETQNSDGFTIKTMTGTYTSTNKGTENNTIVESVANFTYETPVKLETEYGTHTISPLNVKFEEKGFQIKELSSTEESTSYQTINTILPIIIVPDTEDCSLATINEEVILKQRAPRAPDVIRTDSTYVLKGNGDKYIVEKIIRWSDNSETSSIYEYEGSHSITAIDFGEKITSSLNWTANPLELTKSTASKTDEKKFSENTKFVAVYSNKTHSASASNNSESGIFSYKENSPSVTFIDGDIEKTFPSRGYTLTDNGAQLSSNYTEIVKNSVAYNAYEYNHSISCVWDNSSAENLVSKGTLLLTADVVGEATYEAKQTWNGNQTTITVIKTIPHSHADDEQTTYKTTFTVSLDALTNGSVYADNTSFEITQKLTDEKSTNTTDGLFTISERTRSYDYTLSNGVKSRIMPTTLKDAKITFNDGTYSKTFDVYLTLSNSSSFGTAYENGDYLVTPHTLSLTAKTVDNKTLTTSGKTDIYIKKPNATYQSTQTWNGNTTTIKVIKTTPQIQGEDKVETYEANFTVSLKGLTNDVIYADNTSFSVSQNLTNEKSNSTTNGYFTISERVRNYNYTLSNGVKTRNLPTELKDATIKFDDGVYSKTYDVSLTLSHTSSFGTAYDSNEYTVTPHTLNLTAKTVDNKTLTTSGTTDIYVQKPSKEPELPHLGKPKGFTVTATFDPETKVTRRAFCFNWEDGVTYAVCDYETMLPKSNDFKYKVDTYTGYNSVGYNKNNSTHWEPTRGVDDANFITWYSATGTKVSAIDKDITCKAIGWKNIVNGKYALVIEGYTYTINGYDITITAPNGEKVTFNSHYNE